MVGAGRGGAYLLVDTGSDSKIDDDSEGRTKDDSCFPQVCLWKKDIKMEDAPEV